MGITSIKLRNISLAALIFTLFTFVSVYPVAAQQGVPIDRDSGVDIVAGPHNVTVVMVNQTWPPDLYRWPCSSRLPTLEQSFPTPG